MCGVLSWSSWLCRPDSGEPLVRYRNAGVRRQLRVDDQKTLLTAHRFGTRLTDPARFQGHVEDRGFSEACLDPPVRRASRSERGVPHGKNEACFGDYLGSHLDGSLEERLKIARRSPEEPPRTRRRPRRSPEDPSKPPEDPRSPPRNPRRPRRTPGFRLQAGSAASHASMRSCHPRRSASPTSEASTD